MTKRIAIIPARGGSTRLPRKNIMSLCGRPLIGWTIKAAVDSCLFEKVLVSTDDQEIAAIARDCGAQVPFLRDLYADNYSPSSLATISTLEQAEAFWEERFEIVAQLLPTCPLRTADDISQAIGVFEREDREFQISAFEFGWMNPWWALKLSADGQPEWMFPEALTLRSQDLESLYCPSGAVWIARADPLRAAGSFYGPGHCIQPIAWQSGIDIDDIDDFHMAEALAMLQKRETTG